MIVWRGKGILVLLSAGLAALITFGLLGSVLNISPYNIANHTGKDSMRIGATIFLLATLINSLTLLIPFLKDKPDEFVTRPDGSRVRISYTGSFFYIPRKIWSFLFGAIALVLLILSF